MRKWQRLSEGGHKGTLSHVYGEVLQKPERFETWAMTGNASTLCPGQGPDGEGVSASKE